MRRVFYIRVLKLFPYDRARPVDEFPANGERGHKLRRQTALWCEPIVFDLQPKLSVTGLVYKRRRDT